MWMKKKDTDVKKVNRNSDAITYHRKSIYILKSFSKNIIDLQSNLVKPSYYLAVIILIAGFVVPKTLWGIPLLFYSFVPMFFLLILNFREMIHDLLLYSAIFNSAKYNEEILSNKKDVSLYKIEYFYLSFNNFRNGLKRHIGRVNSPLLTHDYMVESTFKNIDIFFDIVIHIISKKRGYLLEATCEDIEADKDFYKSLPGEVLNFLREYQASHCVDHELISIFMESFNDAFINNTKPAPTKVIYVREFFEEWNYILSSLESDAFKSSEEKVNEFYDKKYQRYESIIKHSTKIVEMFVASVFAIVLSVIASGIYSYLFPK